MGELKFFKHLKYVSVCSLLCLISCNKEDNSSEENFTDTSEFVTTNPIALDLVTSVNSFEIKKKDFALFSQQASGTNESDMSAFEQAYGKIRYSDLVMIDSTNTNTLFPLTDDNGVVRSLLVGYYDSEGIIQYLVKEIKEDSGVEVRIGENERMYYDLSDKNYYYYEIEEGSSNESSGTAKSHTIHSSSSGQACGFVYVNVCGTAFGNDDEPPSGSPDWACSLVYDGFRCWAVGDTTVLDAGDSSGGGGITEDDGDDGWTPVGGGSSSNCSSPRVYDPVSGSCILPCDPGFENDENGNCVKTPCGHLDDLYTDAQYVAKVNQLKGNTGLQQESGFSQNSNGSFTTLQVAPNGHNLYIPSNSTSMIGYVHTHLDDFDKVNSDGTITTNKIYRMFSPADLRTFLNMVRNASANNFPLDKIYATMVSSSGIYTMRFTGDVSSINTTFNPRDDRIIQRFKKLIDRFGRERGFLKFIKDVTNNSGVDLAKINNDGTIDEKELDDQGKLDTNPCEN